MGQIMLRWISHCGHCNNIKHTLSLVCIFGTICEKSILICCLITCFESSPVAERSIVFGLRLLEVHAVDGAAVHGGGALPGGLGPGRVVRDVGTYGHRWRGVCSLCLWGQRRGLGGGGRA